MVRDDLIESDRSLPEDEITMRELEKIGSSIHPSIKTTSDFPSNNADRKMPLLDLKIWSENNTVRFSYYEKPKNSNFLFLFRAPTAGRLRLLFSIGKVSGDY